MWRFEGVWKLLRILKGKTIAAVTVYDWLGRLNKIMTVHRQGIFLTHIIQEDVEPEVAPQCARLMTAFRTQSGEAADVDCLPAGKQGLQSPFLGTLLTWWVGQNT